MIHTIRRIVALPFDLIRMGVRVFFSFQLLRWCLLPWAVGGVVSALSLGTLVYHSGEIASLFGLDPSGIVGGVVSLLGVGFGAILAALLGYLAALVAGGFFFDFLIEEYLAAGQHPYRPNLSTTARFRQVIAGWCEDLALLGALAFVTIVATISSIFPPLAIISVILGASILGFEMIDKPLAILGARVPERIKAARDHPVETISLGLLGMTVAVIPLLNLVTLPLFYLVATQRVIQWQRSATS